MRIAWFTPFDKRSAIGRVGLSICEVLAQSHDVDIWCYETKDTLQTNIPVIHFDPASLNISKLGQYDHVIYNMGNYAGYHWAVYEAMQQFPGVLILHDRTMFGFYMQLCDMKCGIGTSESYLAFRQILNEEYGSDGVRAIERYNNTDIMTQCEDIVHFSLIRKMSQNAKAIFTHSKAYCNKVQDYSLVPAGYSYLPYEPAKRDFISLLPDNFERNPEKTLVISNGLVHPVKHIMDMVNVMLKNRDIRESIQYVVIGEAGGPYGEQLKNLASTTLKDCLYILGYQSYETMESFLNAADICVNLRHPNSEVCSLSLFEQMSYGKPVIVYNVGIFEEMPDDTVYKIDLRESEEQLSTAIRTLIENKKAREQIGHNAQEFIRNNCTIDGYCSRLIDFLENLNQIKEYSKFNTNLLHDLHNEIHSMGINMLETPEALDDIVYTTCQTIHATEKQFGQKDIVAIWAAFPYTIPGLHREGTMKLNAKMLEALIQHTPLKFEIWTYETNAEEVKLSFEKTLEDPTGKDRIKIITEANWRESLPIPLAEKNVPYDISIDNDNLGYIANIYSEAMLFAPVMLYLDNVLQTKRPIYIPALDMSVKEYYEDFVFKNPNMKFQARDIESRASRLFRRGMYGYTMSRSVKNNQILPLIHTSEENRLNYVWTPDMFNSNVKKPKDSEAILSRLKIKKPYLFYATQLRPNKNIETLMKAMDLLIDNHPDLSLILTGRLEDLPDIQQEWRKRESYSHLVFARDLTDEELYALYYNAACVPVPTVLEGGFPLQAIEALKTNVPVVLSNIDVVQERIEGCGFTEENCGLCLYNSYDEKALASKIHEALISPEIYRGHQQKFWESFCQYTWKEAADKHYHLMMKAAGRAE